MSGAWSACLIPGRYAGKYQVAAVVLMLAFMFGLPGGWIAIPLAFAYDWRFASLIYSRLPAAAMVGAIVLPLALWLMGVLIAVVASAASLIGILVISYALFKHLYYQDVVPRGPVMGPTGGQQASTWG